MLLVYVFLVGPDGFHAMARADTQYSQLSTLAWGETGRIIAYEYDANGSLTTKTTKSDPTTVVERVEYKYSLQNRLSRVETYDGTATLITAADYKYNPQGIRVEKSVDGVSTEYLIDPYNHTGYAQALEETTDDGVTQTRIQYTIGDDVISQTKSTRNGSAWTANPTQYLLYDGHGSTRQLARPDKSVVEHYHYDAYGVMLGSVANPADNAQTNYLYAGEQYDSSVQQYYNRARYYNPSNGLFNRVDPYAGNLHDPQSLHKYLYCHANPVNGIDPTGEYSIPQVVTALAITSFLFNVGITFSTSYNIAKDFGTIDGVVVNFGLSVGGKGLTASLIVSLVWYWKTNTFSLLGTFEAGIAPITAFKKTKIRGIVGTAGVIVNSNSAKDLEGFGITATWPKALMKHIIPKKYSGIYSTMMFLANHTNKKPLPLQGVYKKKPGVFQLTQSTSGAVMMTAGIWDYTFGTTFGITKAWQLDNSMPDALRDIIERVKPKMQAINKNSANEQWGSLLDDI